MSTKAYHPPTRDKRVYIGRFRGYRMEAFGCEQILDYEAQIQVYQLSFHPQRWVARDARGKMDPAFSSASAEECMRRVAAGFTQCLEAWQAYLDEGLLGRKKLGPQMVNSRERSA